MELNQISNYEKYLLMCGKSNKITPTYSAYMEFKELYGIIRRLSTNGSGQYTFNGKQYRTAITATSATQILSDFDSGEFNSASLSIVTQLGLKIS